MPKLLFTVTNDLNYDQRMIRICSTLQEAGYEVTLIGRRRNTSVGLKEQSFQQVRLRCFFDSGKLFYAEYNLRLFFYLLSHSFDAVCGVDLDTLVPAFIVSSLKRKPCIYDAHEYFTELPEVVDRPFTQKVWSLVANSIVPRLKHCYTVCHSLAKIFQKNYGPEFEVIRNVPFLKTSPTKQRKAPKILLYQGALNEGRGIEVLLQSMQQLEGVELWLAGEGILSEELRKLSAELNLGSRVKFLGYLLPEELKSITKMAYAGLNLLENKGLNYYYSLANKAFDYVQAEIPTLNMDFPEYRVLNQEFETAILIPDLQLETVVAALQSLLEDEQLYLRLQQNARLAKQVWCWEREQEILLNFYERLLSKPGLRH